MRVFHFALFAACAVLAAPTTAVATPHAVKHAARHAKHFAAKRAPRPDDGIAVPIDEARVITFKQPVATVFIGNPTVADVTMIDSRHAYVLGKTFGATNLIGLNAEHTPVVNAQISVANRMVGSVTLNRGAETYNYSCTRLRCETGPRPGDPLPYVTNTESAASAHADTATKASAVAMGTPQ